MDLDEVVRRRRMVRSFADRHVDPAVVQRLVTQTLRAPTAGNTRGTAWVVLQGAEETGRYWARVTTPGWRARSRRWAGLSRAPVVALSLASPGHYVARYAEPDKDPGSTATEGSVPDVAAAGSIGEPGPHAPPGDAGPALGSSLDSWPVPYWFGDAAFATMTLLLGATSEGLGACFLGNFRGEGPLLEALGVPDGWRLFGAVLLGHPDGADHRSRSLERPGPTDASRVHLGRW